MNSLSEFGVPAVQTLEDLKLAQQRIADEGKWRRGWLGRYRSEGGALCTMGAIAYATGEHHTPWSRRRYRAAGNALAEANYMTSIGHVMSRNDSNWTEHRDVMAWFNRAIRQMERRAKWELEAMIPRGWALVDHPCSRPGRLWEFERVRLILPTPRLDAVFVRTPKEIRAAERAEGVRHEERELVPA